ncbi:MAG: hypothetical protein WCF68_16165 [Terriglobales bacterium]
MRRIGLLVVILLACFAATAWAPESVCCRATVKPLPIVFANETNAVGCTKTAAMALALAKIGNRYCIGAYDPQCTGVCANQKDSCLPTAKASYVAKPPVYTKIHLQGCKTPPDVGWQVDIHQGQYTCGCKCRKTPNPGTDPDAPNFE